MTNTRTEREPRCLNEDCGHEMSRHSDGRCNVVIEVRPYTTVIETDCRCTGLCVPLMDALKSGWAS